MIRPLILSAPFGNYFDVDGVTSTLGTFTLHPRRTAQLDRDGNYAPRDERFWWAGMLWRVARTLRYRPSLGGWTNKLGLRNPGIESLGLRWNYGSATAKRKIAKRKIMHSIVSIHGFTEREWELLLENEMLTMCEAVCLNFSCPNLDALNNSLTDAAVVVALARGMRPSAKLIAKLPPVETLQWADRLLAVDPNLILHCCNTLPCQHGGLSGSRLRSISLLAVCDIRTRYPNVRIIGGGGISKPSHAAAYVCAGANHVAMASALLHPFAKRRVRRVRDAMAAFPHFIRPNTIPTEATA